ncbi:hypothetical protein [Streptomyces sp. NPDC058268]|uniref:hypothetical protein n=1 Tax=Streptomyces sp. NPDC058268 TaxID=3346413 RepID=UPI0036EDFF18
MIPSPPVCGSARSAAVVNDEIRELWPHPAVRLSSEQRARYEELVAEWAAVSRAESMRGEIVEAA